MCHCGCGHALFHGVFYGVKSQPVNDDFVDAVYVFWNNRFGHDGAQCWAVRMICGSFHLILKRTRFAACSANASWERHDHVRRKGAYCVSGCFCRFKPCSLIFSEYHEVAACYGFLCPETVFDYEVAFHVWDFPAFPVTDHGFLLEAVAEVA